MTLFDSRRIPRCSDSAHCALADEGMRLRHFNIEAMCTLD
jgi:hypothetical protein